MSNTLTDLERSAIRLETTAASLAGIYGRGDVSEIDQATENHSLDAQSFRQQLELSTGMKSSQIHRLLNL